MKEIQKEVIRNAIMRVEIFLIISMGLVLAVFVPFPFGVFSPFFWLILAFGGSLGLFLLHLNDPKNLDESIENVIRKRCPPAQISNPTLRAEFLKAVALSRNIYRASLANSGSITRDELLGIAEKTLTWVFQIYNLCELVDNTRGLEKNSLQLEQELAALKVRARTSQASQDAMTDLINTKTAQIEAVKRLKTMLDDAHLQIESSLTKLEMIHTESLNINTTMDRYQRGTDVFKDLDREVSKLTSISQSLKDQLK